MKRTLRILIVLLILLPFAANAQGENPVWTAERLLSDDEIAALAPTPAETMQKSVRTLADAVALLNACIQSGRFKEIIDGSQASVPGSDTYTFSSGEACLSGDQYVDPKDFNFMTAYLLADDFTTGVLMGIPAGGPSQAIGYVELDGEVLFFDAAAQITHGRIRQFVFSEATVSSLQAYVDALAQKQVYRILFSIPDGLGFRYTDHGTYVTLLTQNAAVYWSAENEP